MKRRALLRLLAVAAGWIRIPLPLFAQPVTLSAADEGRVRALAEAVLPSEVTPTGRSEVVDGFLRWIRSYREGAEMDHGYGFTRLRQTPPSPAAAYPAQLAALDRAARARGAAFDGLDLAARRAVVAAAIDSLKIDRLPVRPSGDHVATDLMAFYFSSEAANDLAYRAAIRRDSCRGLPGSESAPSRLRVSSELAQSQLRAGSESAPSRLRAGSESAQSEVMGRLKLQGRGT
jgi:hypothetical protein